MKIAEIIVGDDCSIPASDQGRAGKRGLVGLLFVIKITGAMAERGNSIDEILYHAKVVADCIATYGVGLRSCSLPGLLFFFTFFYLSWMTNNNNNDW